MGENLHRLTLMINHGWNPAVIGQRRMYRAAHAVGVGLWKLPNDPGVELFEGNGRWLGRFKCQFAYYFCFPIHHVLPLNQPRVLKSASNTDEVSVKFSNK